MQLSRHSKQVLIDAGKQCLTKHAMDGILKLLPAAAAAAAVVVVPSATRALVRLPLHAPPQHTKTSTAVLPQQAKAHVEACL